MTVTVSSKGQVTLPAEARRQLGIRAGTKLEVIVRGDRLEVVLVGGSVKELKGILPPSKRRVTLAEMEEAIVKGATRSVR